MILKITLIFGILCISRPICALFSIKMSWPYFYSTLTFPLLPVHLQNLINKHIPSNFLHTSLFIQAVLYEPSPLTTFNMGRLPQLLLWPPRSNFFLQGRTHISQIIYIQTIRVFLYLDVWLIQDHLPVLLQVFPSLVNVFVHLCVWRMTTFRYKRYFVDKI